MIYDGQYFEDDFDSFYDDPSEYESMVYELKDKLKESVKKDILDELNRLRSQVAELSEVKKNWDERCRKQDEEHAKAMWELEETKRNLRRVRASELLQEFAEELWGIDFHTERLPKCDRCDERRRRVTKGALGNPIIEYCECSRYKLVYSIKNSKLVRVDFDESNGEVKSSAYYLFKDNEESCHPVIPKISDDIPFEQLHRETYKIAFRSKEKAQAYCDYLNTKEKWHYSSV